MCEVPVKVKLKDLNFVYGPLQCWKVAAMDVFLNQALQKP